MPAFDDEADLPTAQQRNLHVFRRFQRDYCIPLLWLFGISDVPSSEDLAPLPKSGLRSFAFDIALCLQFLPINNWLEIH